ncbi:hypothetical protein [Shewanella acanthi]|uniref:hypothetical protein n=1 Tax=Shewanella acanthi TaxID=2864212 RepID=UPI001C65E829|nr:hypothetical protein [Shewanella acanthi]QYJ78612.1 hypothetical protein K0H61_16235 [Shewanella acanthi]
MTTHLTFKSILTYPVMAAVFLSTLVGCGGGGGDDSEEVDQVTVGGKVVNLNSTLSIQFIKNGQDWETISVTASGQDVPFKFVQAQDVGTNFGIRIQSITPENVQTCSITSGGSGVLTEANAQSTVITCTDMAAKVGVFVDSEVGNIEYSTETLAGFTNEQGEFSYLEGETVTFKLGEAKLPPAKAKPVLTPLDLASTDSVDDPKVVNLVRLLMTLDTNGDPSDGLYLDSALSTNIHQLDFGLSIDAFASSAAIKDILAMANLQQTKTDLVSIEEAKNHIIQTLIEQGLWPDPNDTCNEDLVFNLLGHDIITQPNGEMQQTPLTGTLTVTPTLGCTLAVNEGYSGGCVIDGDAFSAFNGAMLGTVSNKQATLVVKNHSSDGEDVAVYLRGDAQNNCSAKTINDGQYSISGTEAVITTDNMLKTYKKYRVNATLTINNGECSVVSSEGAFSCSVNANSFQGLGDASYLQGTINEQSVSYFLPVVSDEAETFYGQYHGRRDSE